jgi:hypothetical protein
MPPGYHKILGAVKGSRPTPPSWGSVGGHRSLGKMTGKLGRGSGRVWLITMTRHFQKVGNPCCVVIKRPTKNHLCATERPLPLDKRRPHKCWPGVNFYRNMPKTPPKLAWGMNGIRLERGFLGDGESPNHRSPLPRSGGRLP